MYGSTSIYLPVNSLFLLTSLSSHLPLQSSPLYSSSVNRNSFKQPYCTFLSFNSSYSLPYSYYIGFLFSYSTYSTYPNLYPSSSSPLIISYFLAYHSYFQYFYYKQILIIILFYLYCIIFLKNSFLFTIKFNSFSLHNVLIFY